MTDAAGLLFVACRLKSDDVRGKDVVELGSLIVDETCREFVLSRGPRRYVGIDMRAGPGVDVVMDVCDAPSRYPEGFDVIVCNSMLEHAPDFFAAIAAIKKLCRPGTKVYITVPTIGFRYHAHPGDHWRPTRGDFAEIFADMEIHDLVEDVEGAQIMMSATATAITGKYTPVFPIYNVVYERRTKPLREEELASRRYARYARLRVFKVGVQDIMGALALFVGMSLARRKAPIEAPRAWPADRVAAATKTDA